MYTKNNSGKYEVSKNGVIIVEWYSVSGQYYKEFFCTPENPRYRSYDVSYVHKWQNPEEGVRQYLTHLPLLGLKITFSED